MEEQLFAKVIYSPEVDLINVIGIYGCFHTQEMREFLEAAEDGGNIYYEDVKREIEAQYGDKAKDYFYIAKCELNYVPSERFGSGISEFNPAYYMLGKVVEITKENYETTEWPNEVEAE